MPASSRSSKPAAWPEPVERIAALLRTADVQGRIEELPADVDEPPGPAVHPQAFDRGGGVVVALVPTDREVDREKLGATRPAQLPPFPFQTARVVVDRSILAEPIVWLEAGSPRHVLGLAPSYLVRVTKAETRDVLLPGDVHDRGPG